MFRSRLIPCLLALTLLAETTMASTRSRCERDLQADGWTVIMSQKYSELELSAILACFVGT